MYVLKIVGQIILLIVGFILLIKGADIFVEGASKIAVKANIPQMVVGLTIVALGTSAPEAAVSIKAAFSGGSDVDMTVGNVLGSNILNILIILGVTALVAALPVKKNTLRIDIPIVLVVTLVFLGLGYFDGRLGRIDGVILYVMLIAFITYLVISAKNGESEEDIVLTDKDKTWRLILLVLIGAGIIVIGSNFTVNAASYIAGACGMSTRLISLTIVAFGTSLPELVTSVTAARKGQTDIAIGNIVGSNILNILFVAGTTCLIRPIPFNGAYLVDSLVAVLAVILLFAFSIGKKKLTKTGGVVMLVVYAGYFAYIMLNNYGVI
jgi:cation:H+ antiporter